MANKSNKVADNVTGKWYVDDQCIACDACVSDAPNNFETNADAGYVYVKKQPDTPEEETQCVSAKEGCPVDAIGDDG